MGWAEEGRRDGFPKDSVKRIGSPLKESNKGSTLYFFLLFFLPFLLFLLLILFLLIL